jgi:phosphatidylserine/phosphatidylglycerophosphate/cardiolipin synthase-like enzyme
MHRALLLVLLFCIAPPAGAYLIAEVCPDTWLSGEPDEFFVLAGEGALDGVAVTDGEGTVSFPPGASGNGRVVVARNGTAYALVHGTPPDYEIQAVSAAPDMVRIKDLRLGNEKDELVLLVRGAEADRVSWPGDVVGRQGQVHYREDGRWDPRVLMIGQSRFSSLTVANVSGTAFVAPDCSSAVLADLVASASRSLRLNAYELTDPVLAEALVAAKARGVFVTVLIEGGPVGGIPSGEWAVLARLLEAGIPVRSMATGEAAHARYRFDHAKYMVVDDRWTLVTTENWKPAAFPPAGRRGNRGWGVVLDDPRVAAYFARLFETDLEGRDTEPVVTPRPGGAEAPDDRSYSPRFTPAPFSDATVTTVLAPDTADEVTALIASARSSVRIQQAYITNESGDRLQRYLAAAVDAARRGVEVRVLLDAAWFNTADEADNDEQVALINRIAAAEGLRLEARLVDLDARNLVKVHTKGVVVDGRRVFVSSINWNEASPSFNREAGVIVDDPSIGAYFEAAFDADWGTETSGSAGGVGRGIDWFRLGCAALVAVGCAAGVMWEKRRRRG